MLHKSKLAFWQAQMAGTFPGSSLAYDFTNSLSPLIGSPIPMTRSTTATYYNSSGLRVTAAVNEPRLDYNPNTLAPEGYLMEQQKTNLFLQSNNFNDAIWSKPDTTITTAAGIGASGLQDMDLIQIGNLGTAFVQQDVTIGAGAILTISADVKKSTTGSWLRIQVSSISGADGFRGWFNLDTGAWGTTSVMGAGTLIASSVVYCSATGIYRISITGILNGSDTTARSYIISSNADNSTLRLSNANWYMGNTQLEVGTCPTSVIVTGASQVIRAADIALSSSISSWYNQSEGTILIEGKTFDPCVTQSPHVALIGFDDNTASNRHVMRLLNLGTGQTLTATATAAATVAAITATPVNTLTTYKVGYVYGLNNFAGSRNGSTPVVDSNGTPPNVARVTLGFDISGGANANIWIRKFAYWPYQRSNSELMSITS
ncbi:hypothetical protein LZD49_33510 [Dyadobacter sp. CY261]|uniref:phage head spike fiber domain-containing protein n=1 Tax=Dyadobacter sp. CY261 TaxID=2907203 RepID=UPI001F2BD8CF|nr:hypothetical protein [Dyadobacter sp. CY261]MCF0075445.1 hypothetical protein [Dyadobacter sp. CY261]